MDKQTILIIEDDNFFKKLISQKLAKEGFGVLAASDSKEAMAAIEKTTPALILLDLILPGMSGFDILAMLKKDPKTKEVPVIVATNLGQKEDVDRAKALGAEDFLIKVNFMPDEIVAKVKTILGKKYL